MQVHSNYEADECDDMLKNENLIAPSTNRSKRAEDNPDQDYPGSKTAHRDAVCGQFDDGVVAIGSPAPKPVAHVYSGCEQE